MTAELRAERYDGSDYENRPVEDSRSPPVSSHVDQASAGQAKPRVPIGAKWTKISRKRVSPEALTLGKKRFKVRGDSVIVQRILTLDEIREYKGSTAQIRDARQKSTSVSQKKIQTRTQMRNQPLPVLRSPIRPMARLWIRPKPSISSL
ncbi:hypothetical protein B0H65DRAFT_216945 [Neurospora tetraspora]|uniref:DUF8035 domain-containing protein n=1 Tax=Neurospora tetraspora TaxID=94610 RepID=A0AAE0JBV2_9PEZI|nr:hypothetical protein B0H65DRAFT_216945 [Neurospora tetraspora]